MRRKNEGQPSLPVVPGPCSICRAGMVWWAYLIICVQCDFLGNLPEAEK